MTRTTTDGMCEHQCPNCFSVHTCGRPVHDCRATGTWIPCEECEIEEAAQRTGVEEREMIGA